MAGGLFELADIQSVREKMAAFSECTGLALEILDAQGAPIAGCGATICPLRASGLMPRSSCEAFTANACGHAGRQAEAHVFMCPVELTRIACVIRRRNTVLGTLMSGPFLMDAPDPTMLLRQKLFSGYGGEAMVNLYDLMLHLPVLEAQRVHHMAQLLEGVARSLLSSERDRAQDEQARRVQQAFINQTIQQFKGLGEDGNSEYPLMREKAMQEQFGAGNLKGAETIMDEILAFCYIHWGQRLTLLRERVSEIGAVLSRVALENGVPSELVYDVSDGFYRELASAGEYADYCDAVREYLRSLGETLVTLRQMPGSDVVRRAVGIVYDRYAESITLESVADELGVSRYYLSRAFNRCAGLSFRDFVNHVRIEQGKRLLRGTDMTLVEIAVSIGFSDQSYFSKVFKKSTGITPKQYR